MPDGTRSERRRSPSRAAMGIVAAVALVAGSVTLGALTAPDPAPESAFQPSPVSTSSHVDALESPIDTDNFSVDQIAVGTPLRWELAAGVDGVFGQHLVQHGGITYLFGAFTDQWDTGPAATLGWRSEDGRNWESLGRVLETEHPIHLVSSTPGGLIAAEMGEPDPVIWRSDDGTGWQREVVPVGAPSPYWLTYPTAVAADGEVTVIAGDHQPDLTSLLQERLESAGIEVDLSRFGWDQEFRDGEMRFVVYGPLGIRLADLTYEEMGLTEEEVDAVNPDGAQSPANVWVEKQGLDWQQRTIEGAGWVESLTFVGPRLIAFGYDQLGDGTWASDDGGLTWEETVSSAGHPYEMVRWGERFVGMEQGGAVDVTISEDGLTWEGADLDEHFPYQLGWSPWALSAGDGGIAFVAEVWRPSGMETARRPSSLTRDGVTLNVNPEMGQFDLIDGNDVHIWPMHTGESQEGIVVDMTAEQVHFHDPDSGVRLVSFTIDELTAAEETYWRDTSGGESFQAFVFSRDAVDWIIQDVEDDFGDGTRVFDISVAEDTVTALVNSRSNLYGAEPGFEIWAAPIP